MLNLVNRNTRVVCQGFTGEQGTLHSKQAIEYGTNIVCGVTPGKGGTSHLGLPVFDTVKEAVIQKKANTSIIYVPAQKCKDSVLEAIDAGIELIVCITEGIPILDMLKIKLTLKKSKSFMIGPNCPGIIVPSLYKIGIMPSNIYKPGNIGIISRSGTLTYEITKFITESGLGQSICIGIGGDPILGSDFVDVLKILASDENTKVIVMIGEIGGYIEEKAASYIKFLDKPVISYVAGLTAPHGRKMGHAGAIINSNENTAQNKIKILKNSGAIIAYRITEIVSLINNILK